MRFARRTFLAATLATASAPFVEPVARSIADAMTGAAKAARPASSGTTATRCAQCGSNEHSMLDRRGPMAPRVVG